MKMLLLDGLFVATNLDNLPEYDDKNVLQYLFDKAQLDNYDRYVLLQTGNIENVPSQIKNVVLDDLRVSHILSVIYENCRNCDDVVVINAGSPFYDSQFVGSMLTRHADYMADYTYCLGYPDGMVPTVVKKNILPELAKLTADEVEPHKDYLFFALSKDINSFDIETFLSPVDLRLARLTFGSDNYQIAELTKSIFAQIKNMTLEEQVRFLDENKQLYFAGPFMVSLDVADSSVVSSTFSVKCSDTGKMLDFADYQKLIDWTVAKQGYKMTFVFAGVGEPLLHPDILKMLQTAITNHIDVVVETFGVGETVGNVIKQIADFPDEIKSNLAIVIKFDAYFKETYDKLHENGNFDEVLANFSILNNANVKTYKSVVRILDNEVEIEQYIRQGQTDNLIIRKHSSYCGTLPDKRVVDLSPFQRCPCFHLRRELSVLPTGEVSLCSFARDEIIGMLKTDSIDEIIDKQRHYYEDNALKKLNKSCQKCDEYYIFNF